MLLMSDTKTCPKCGGELDHDDDDHYYTCRDCYEDWSEYNLLDCLAAKTAECERLRRAIEAMADVRVEVGRYLGADKEEWGHWPGLSIKVNHITGHYPTAADAALAGLDEIEKGANDG